jgi:hypothetical protein
VVDDLDGDHVLVALYASGSADEDELNADIAKAWTDALSDPAQRAAIAQELGVAEDALDPKTPPVKALGRGAGLTGAEILILGAFAGAVVHGAGEELGKASVKWSIDALRSLWRARLRPKVNPVGKGRLGSDKTPPEAG